MSKNITAAQVKELREMTGAGMMECKQALVATNNLEEAVDYLRKMGQAKVAKKAARIATDGIIKIAASADRKTAFILEINTETDFVARDQTFLNFVEKIANQGLAHLVVDVPGLLNLPFTDNNEKTIAEEHVALVSKLGENIQIRRVALFQSEQELGIYVHGTKIGVVVELSATDQELAKDLAMHIAASKPEVVLPEDIPAALIAKEKEIYLAQVAQSGKPEAIVEKMVAGRIQKFVKEISLVGQPFVKDPLITVGELIDQHKVKVLNFIRFEVGEGIEKTVKDFAQEVMDQVKRH